MKGDYKYTHLRDDSKILGIGSLFRGAGRRRWSINFYLEKREQSYINISAAPILARHRILNPSKHYARSGKSFSFTIENAQNWKAQKISDCPALSRSRGMRDGNQNCFAVDTGGTTVFVPQFELARALFYHDPYMARLSLQHNSLNEDYYVDGSGEKPVIHVLSDAEYPISYYNRDDNRRFLSWVLLDRYARESFESIGAGLVTDRYLSKDETYEHWDFKFIPPPLAGVELSVTGWHDFASGTFFVWEVCGLGNLPSSVSGEVDFINPKYKRSVGGKSTRGDGAAGDSSGRYELDDDELSDIDKATVQLQSDRVTVSFANAFMTNRISTTTRSVNHEIGEGDKEVVDNQLSANEKEITGALPGGSWNNLNDQTDDAHLYLSKFSTFIKMVDVLEKSHGCKVVRKRTEKLPKVGGSKKHWLADSMNPRCIAIVELIHNSNLITLLEIDTSDGAAKISTMMLKTSNSGWLTDNWEKIKIGIINKSLRWPTDIFRKELTGAGYSGVPHPKSKHSGKLEENEIAPMGATIRKLDEPVNRCNNLDLTGSVRFAWPP